MIVQKLGIKPDEPWQAWLVIGMMLIFRLAIQSDKIQKQIRAGEDLQRVLKVQGCLACGHYRSYHNVVKFMKAKGLDYSAKVADGRITDPDFEEFKP